jgi:hypothetical protein
VLLEEIDQKINTCVYQIKDVEFSDIVAVGKSNAENRILRTQITGCGPQKIHPQAKSLVVNQQWVSQYNTGRPHMALGPGIPQPPPSLPVPSQVYRHRLPAHLHVAARPILGGLHHEYSLEKKAA